MTWLGSVLGCLLVVAGCGSGSEAPPPAVPPTSSTMRPAAPEPAPSTTTTSTTIAAPPTAPLTPEQARRMLEERGLDPEALSREVGEHMRGRLKATPVE